MNTGLLKRALEIVDDAIELDVADQQQFIQRACAGDHGLMREVNSFLQHRGRVSVDLPDVEISTMTVPNGVSAEERYEFGDEIARGGMGAIHWAYDNGLQREVAVKILLPQHASDQDLINRFISESRVAAQLQHPGVAPVYDLGCLSDGRPFFAMKLVRGETLENLLAKREHLGQDQSNFLTFFEQLCQTVAYAHSHNIIHRDLKPANVMVGQFGEVQLMDWGLAKELPADKGKTVHRSNGLQSHPAEFGKALDGAKCSLIKGGGEGGSASITRLGVVMGTPPYMPPEQVLGRSAKTADVFSLGCILFEILTGHPPNHAHADVDAGRVKTAGARNRLESSDADPILIHLMRNCLSNSPQERWKDAGELARELSQFREMTQARLRTAELESLQAQTRAAEGRKRRRVTVALAVSIFSLVVLGMIAWNWNSWQRARHAEAYAALERQAALTAESQSYRNAMIAAFAEFDTGRFLQAWQLLLEVGESTRNWEWHYLYNQIEQSLERTEFDFNLDNVFLAGFVRGTEWVRTVDHDGTVRLWDYRAHQLVETQPTDFVLPWLLGPHGNLVLSGLDSPLLWDARTGQKLQQFDISVNRTNIQSAISPSGDHVAIHAADGNLHLYENTTGRLLHIFKDNCGQPCFCQDGRWLVWCQRATIHFWDIEKSMEARRPVESGMDTRSGSLCKLALSDDRSHLACWQDRIIHTWNLDTGDTLEFSAAPSDIASLEFDDSGKYIFAALVNGVIETWKCSTGSLVGRLHSPTVASLTDRRIALAGDKLLTCSLARGHLFVRKWDARATGLNELLGHSSHVYPVVFSPDGARIASGSWDGTIRFWDARTSGEIVKIEPQPKCVILSLAFDHTGNILAAGTSDQRVFIYNGISGQLMHTIKLNDKCYAVAFSPDNSKLVLAHGDISVVDIQSWRVQTSFAKAEHPNHDDYITELAFSPNGDSLVACNGKGWGGKTNAYLFSSSDMRSVAEIQSREPLDTVTWSPDSQLIVMGHKGGQISFWSVSDLSRPSRVIQAHSGEVFALRFLDDGSRLASAGRDGRILLWDMMSLKQIGVLTGHTDYIWSLALSSDGQQLVSGSGDGTVRIWQTYSMAQRLRALSKAKPFGSGQ